MVWEILAGVAAGAIVLAVAITSIVKRKNGKTSCGCGDCSSCEYCRSRENSKESD